jgi:plastocyanin
MTSRVPFTSKPSAWRAAVTGAALIALLGLPASLLAAQGAPSAPPVTAAKVAGSKISIENFEFSPRTVTVPVGTMVTWTNNDGEPHTVTSSAKLFSSSGLDEGESFSYTFASPGTYTYYCQLHPHMTGTIVVK